MSGFYCSKCGRTTGRLPAGAIFCPSCGSQGLRSYSSRRPPVRIACPVEGCDQQVWADGGVNPGTLQHAWEHVSREVRP